MDFLDYGMKNEKSKSMLRRTLAKGALAVEKKRADLYEAYLEKKQISYSEDLKEAEALLARIKEEIAKQEEA